MRFLTTVAAAALTIAIASPVLAQDSRTEVSDDATISSLNNVSVDDFGDMNVYDSQGDEIGEIEEVYGPDDTTPQSAEVDFDDSDRFGDDNRIVPISDFSMNDDNLVLNLDDDAIKALPTE